MLAHVLKKLIRDFVLIQFQIIFSVYLNLSLLSRYSKILKKVTVQHWCAIRTKLLGWIGINHLNLKINNVNINIKYRG